MNNELRTTNYEQRTYRAFTLIELMVGVALLAMVLAFTSVIFKVSIESYRQGSANMEIMQKLRAITDQLNSDFKGLQKDAPLLIWFQQGISDPNRYDQIMFFAEGDFQSIQTYNVSSTAPYSGYIVPQPSGSPVISNLARIYYGQAQSIDPRYGTISSPLSLRSFDRILARRQHLSITNPDTGNRYLEFPINNSGILTINPVQNDWLEHDTNSLSQWQAAAQNPTTVDNIITGCFGTPVSYYGSNRPTVNLANADTLHLLMTERVGNFSVQWSYLYKDVSTGLTHIYWWPSIDPDGSGTFSDFANMMTVHTLTTPAFGFYFNTAPSSFTNWFSYIGAKGFYYPNPLNPLDKPAFPQALKFTFTLYDSKGILKDGRTFTHIVYIGE